MDLLQKVLCKFPWEEVSFILCYYGEANLCVAELARIYDMPRSLAKYKKDKLFERIRQEFMKMCPEGYSAAFLK